MIRLPRPLQPWAPYLELFPPDLIETLGPLVQRLSALIGRPDATMVHAGEEPDGFDGIDRRGDYERLLMSEWLLAEEAPDEFLRRAASSEHTFLHVARHEPASRRGMAAILDAGPDQIGYPRIAHLALLVVLARRAELAGGTLLWCVAQRPEQPPHVGLDRTNILALLAGRTSRQAEPEQLATRWRELNGMKIDERWIIGGRRLAALPESGRASAIVVEDVYEPGIRALDVRLLGPSVHGRRIEHSPARLDLPLDAVATRLLRDPFAPPADASAAGAGPASTVSTGRYAPLTALGSAFSSFLFTKRRNQIIALAGDGKLAIIDRSRRPSPLVWHPLPSDMRPVVAGFLGRTPAALMMSRFTPDKSRLHLWTLDRALRDAVPDALRHAMELPEPDGTISPFVRLVTPNGGDLQLFALLANGTLLRHHSGDKITYTVSGNCAALAAIEKRVVYVHRTDNGWRMISKGYGDEKVREEPCEPDAHRAFIGHGGALGDPNFELIAFEVKRGWWGVSGNNDGGTSQTMHIPEGLTVVGVTAVPQTWRTPLLVMIDEARRQLWLFAPGLLQKLWAAPDTIVQAAASPYEPTVGFLTADGSFFLISVAEMKLMLHLDAEKAR